MLYRGSGCVCERQGKVYPFRKTRCDIYIATTLRRHRSDPVQEQDMAKVHSCLYTLPLWLHEGHVSFFSILDLTASFNKCDIVN